MSKPFARKTIYIRKHNLWILQAIKEVLTKADELGIRCTDSDVVVNALTEYLQEYKKSNVKPLVKEPKGKVELKRTVTCPVQKEWLFQRVEELVKVKKLAGIHTSFSFELCNLAIAGLTSNQEYGTISRNTLKNFKQSKI